MGKKVKKPEKKLNALEQLDEWAYQAYFRRQLWSLKQFAALAAGFTPENYEKFTSKKPTKITAKDCKSLLYALEIQQKFMRDVLKDGKSKFNQGDIQFLESGIYRSLGKFIRWLAESKLPIKNKFFINLPLSFQEIYLESSQFDVALRGARKNSRDYHCAYYLRAAEALLQESSIVLSPTEIYEHPRMQNVLRYIREMGGHYTKRTIIESWLSKLEKRKRGRPKKTNL